MSSADYGLVSIVMPMHNDAKYVIDALNSVFQQTYQHFEILLVDDFSTDNSVEIVKRTFSDKRIRFFLNTQNHGPAYSRNIAIQNALGRWIAFLDADDCWAPQKLEKQLRCMIENNWRFSYTEYFETTESLKPLFLISGPRRIGKTNMKRCCYIGCLTVMFERSFFGTIQVDEGLKKRNDYAMWIQLVNKADAFLVKEPLGYYRKRGGSISSVSVKEKLKWEKIMFQTYVSKTSFGSWVRAFRVAFFTLIKKVFYRKRIN